MDSLKVCIKKIKNNNSVVLTVVQRYSHALMYASKRLRNNKEVILESVKNNAEACKYSLLKVVKLLMKS